MKRIYLNLKRFDVPRVFDGINGIASVGDWSAYIVSSIQEKLKEPDFREADFVIYFPELHILPAIRALTEKSPVRIGCQGIYCEDTSANGNFGAFTTGRTASAMVAAGCWEVLIGHCEERRAIEQILAQAGVEKEETVNLTVNRVMNQEIRCALRRGMRVLYCIGEKEGEQKRWKQVLERQLELGLAGVDTSRVVIAYEPIWSIGPGKIPADKEYITKVACFVKEKTDGMEVVYGGGLKKDNAAMLASIPEIDGGLIALTRFQGEIGFYPEEYLEIVRYYLGEKETVI